MRKTLSVAAALVLAVAAACSDPPEPLEIDDTAIAVLNTTSNDWNNVLIVVNDHFRGGVPLLKAEGRLNAPLSQFDTGYGQRWPAGTRVTKVVVTATSAKGEPVKLEWDISKPRPKKKR